jgi:hypothetical protein
MLSQTTLTATVLLLASSAALTMAAPPTVNLCKADTLPAGWKDANVTAELTAVTQAQIINTNNPITCSGTLQIVDGCTVSFIFLPRTFIISVVGSCRSQPLTFFFLNVFTFTVQSPQL